MTAERPPIRTLVVHDDFRVARIHAASVERIEGFVCVGQAHTAAETREHLERDQVDLLILDIYLPDEDGLSLSRSLTGAGSAPDCIFITAARDLEYQVFVRQSVSALSGSSSNRSASDNCEDKLDAYRRWRTELAASADGEADQDTVDTLYELLRG